MKKHLLILACVCFAIAACDQLNPDGNGTIPDLEDLPSIGGGGNGEEGENNNPTPELTPAQQQAKLQSVGEELIAEFPAEEFENLAKIAEAFEQTYGDRYDLSELEEWTENAMEIMYSETDQNSSAGNSYNHFSNINMLIFLSNHKGLFTFGANKVRVDNTYDGGTKAVFTVEGKTYEAEITSSGKETKGYFKHEYHNDESYGSENYKEEYKCDHLFQVTVNIPENISIRLTEEGNPLATITAKFNAVLSKDHVQVSTDALAVEITAEVNGYELKFSKAGYDGKSDKAQLMTTISKDGTALVTYLASADLNMKYEEVSWEYVYDNYATDKGSETQIIVDKAENIMVAMDILGQIQVTGKCSNGVKLWEEINNVWDALDGWDDETQTEKPADLNAAYKHTEEMNKYIDFGVYYDKGTNKQADLKFEYYYELVEDEWGSWGRYGFYPIIIFNNGSQNKIEDFFTEKAFGNLIENMMQLGESYGDVFGYFMEKDEIVEDIH